MRTIEKEYKIYNFNELPTESAKEEVKRWYLDGQDADMFSDMCIENLKEKFSNSDL